MSTEPGKTIRAILQSAATAIAAPAFLSAQGMNNEIRVGIIGVGGRGSILLSRIVQVPHVRVVAVCDIDPEAQEQASQIAERDKPDVIVEYRKLLDRGDIDAVFVATPVDLHKEMAMAALEVHKHLYLEKPMGNTPEDVKSVFEATTKSRGQLQMGFQLRYDPPRVAAIQHIHQGGIGKVAYMQANRHTSDLPRENEWLFDASRSGNSIVEQAVHIMDIMNWAVQTHPLRAIGSGGINVYHDQPPGRTTYDNYVVIYEYPGDVRLTFTHIYLDPRGFTGISEKIWGSEYAIDLPTGTKYRLEPQKRVRAEPEELDWDRSGDDMTLRAVKAFFQHARDNTEPLNNATYGKYATLMAIMGRTAIDEKRAVTWDEVDI